MFPRGGDDLRGNTQEPNLNKNNHNHNNNNELVIIIMMITIIIIMRIRQFYTRSARNINQEDKSGNIKPGE